MPEKKLGELLIDNNLISQEQFDQALKIQEMHPGEPIGQILCQMGFLRKSDLEQVLEHHHKRRKLGEILVSQKLISEERLNDALEASKKEKIPLGKTLVRRHLLDDDQLARAIALQHDMKFLALSDVRIDPKLASFVNATFAQRLRIVPISCSEKTLTIAMACPIPRDELARLEGWCRMSIVPVIAKESDIFQAQQKMYKILSVPPAAKMQLELTEDQEGSARASKYVSEVISADVEYLTKLILTSGIKEGTSDIHLESHETGMTVRYRRDGVLQTLDMGAHEQGIRGNARQIVSRVKILCDMDIAERRRPQDGSFRMKVTREGRVRTVDFRVSTVPTQFGENVVIRILDKRRGSITLEGLGYPEEVVASLKKVMHQPTGIFLVTGPTGSGKSSTLYAILSCINTPGLKTLTIVDPIEYSIDGITQTEVNEAIGNSFARMLRAFLRQDPDIIMVGEIRDLETASISLRAALTGHAVLSTLHTNDATSAVTRLIDMGVEASLISDTLRCVLAQRLVRRICIECKAPYVPSGKLLEEFGIPPESGMVFLKGKGCPACRYTGFSGRLPVVELWVPTRDELLMVNRHPDNISLRKAVFSGTGRSSMVAGGLKLVEAGETTLEELVRAVPYEQIEEERERAGVSEG